MIRNSPLRRGRIFVLTLATTLVLLGTPIVSQPQVASAHPLGNFTINRYTRIEVHPDQIYLRYVLDMAEIPTFQEKAKADLDRDGVIDGREQSAYSLRLADALVSRLHLTVDGSPVGLEITQRDLSFPPGQGGLPTTRLSLGLEGDLRPADLGKEMVLHYRDDNYPQKLGWQEVILTAGKGISLSSSTAPQQDVSNELGNYPNDLLSSPPQRREAHANFTVASHGMTPSMADTVSASSGPIVESSDGLTSLITNRQLSSALVALAFLLALGLGAAHALTPGHGKTVMAAYLVGTWGTGRHAIFLGFTVTISHTLGVLALGLVTLYLSHLISPETLYPWLGLISGTTVVGVGLWLLVARFRQRSGADHDHAHGHHHGHSHAIHHAHPHGDLGISWKNLAALGAANGLIPSASALIIFLAAISLQRVGLGILLILAFSTGMAAVLAGIGLLLVYARRYIERFKFQNSLTNSLYRLVPVGTGLVVLVSGLVVALRALFQVGLL